MDRADAARLQEIEIQLRTVTGLPATMLLCEQAELRGDHDRADALVETIKATLALQRTGATVLLVDEGDASDATGDPAQAAPENVEARVAARFRRNRRREPSAAELAPLVAAARAAALNTDDGSAEQSPTSAEQKAEQKAARAAERRVQERTKKECDEFTRRSGGKPDRAMRAMLEEAARVEEHSGLREHLGAKPVLDTSDCAPVGAVLPAEDRRPRERHNRAPAYRIDPATRERTLVRGKEPAPAPAITTDVGRRQDGQAENRELVLAALRKARDVGVDEDLSLADIIKATVLSRTPAKRAVEQLVDPLKMIEATGEPPRQRYRLK
jgi:hypothetical protein